MALTKMESRLRNDIISFVLRLPRAEVPAKRSDEPARASAIPNPIDLSKIR